MHERLRDMFSKPSELPDEQIEQLTIDFRMKKTVDEQNYLTNDNIELLISKIDGYHPWFTRPHLSNALQSFGDGLQSGSRQLLMQNKLTSASTLGFWLRPLSPFDGMMPLFVSLLNGFRCIIKTDTTEQKHYEAFFHLLENYFPGIAANAEFADKPFGTVSGYVIAGEKPAETQMKYLSSKPLFSEVLPENGPIAYITDNETNEELDALATDICMYFGRSIHNISELLVPESYDFSSLLRSLKKFDWYSNHSRYFNHYEYRKAAFLVSGESFIDNGFLLIRKNNLNARHTGVLNYREYKTSAEIMELTAGKKVYCSKPEPAKSERLFGSSVNEFRNADRFISFLNTFSK
ncbi:MAG: acyl-CoA [Bacteroidetes bacterium]|nr:MAG: acyl-CoA [Bacteroidota bacterium]